MSERAKEPKGQGKTDRMLVRQVLEGCESAVERFVERMRCIPRVLEIKNAGLGAPLSREDRDDLAQEIFSTVWRKLDTYQGEAALETWVYRFCVLKLMSSVKRLARRTVAIDAVPEVGSSDPRAEPLGEPLDYEHIHRGLECVGGVEEEAVTLKHFEDLTFDQIAERLSVSPNTVKTRYYRGIEKLKGALQRGFGGDA